MSGSFRWPVRYGVRKAMGENCPMMSRKICVGSCIGQFVSPGITVCSLSHQAKTLTQIIPYGFYAYMGKADIVTLVTLLRIVKPVVNAGK